MDEYEESVDRLLARDPVAADLFAEMARSQVPAALVKQLRGLMLA
jgi:hypothetical protein